MELFLIRFRLGDFVVDVERCQILRGESIITIEPKVMDVLFYLSKNSGQVINQQQLFAAVWPDAIFNPSSIQRCIALLRKALSEDAKNPQAIITHPKRGYSLELPVEFETSIPLSVKTTNILVNKNFLLFVSLVMLLIIIIITNMIREPIVKIQYSELKPIVSTGQDEFFSRYSPDGKFLAYITQTEPEKNYIWVKNLETGKIIRLNANAENYVSINWTIDQQAITFVKRTHSSDYLGNLPFSKYLIKPSDEQILLIFNDEKIISQLEWSSNGDIFFITQTKDESTNLVQYSTNSHQKIILLQKEKQQNWIDLAISPDSRKLALVSDGKQNIYPISLFDLETNDVSLLASLQGYVSGINWHPNNEYLLVSIRKNLLLLDMQGKVKELDFSNYLSISNANFSPDGKKIAMTLVSIDIDILQMSLNNSFNRTRIVDSHAMDIQPLFSPDTNSFAFLSARSGIMQVFIYENGNQRLLFQNTDEKEFFGMAWSPDAESLAVATEDQLHIINIRDGEIIKTINHDSSSFYLRDWYHNENALLINLRGPVVAKFNLDSFDITQLSEQSSHCATLDIKDNIYLNQTSKILKLSPDGKESIFWQPNDGNIENIVTSDKGLLIELATVETKQLWKVDFEHKNPANIMSTPTNVNWLSDISSDENKILLLSKFHKNKTLVTLQ